MDGYMTQHITQIDMLISDLSEFAQVANVSGVPAGEIVARFKPYGNHHVCRVEIPAEHTGNLQIMLALKGHSWPYQTVPEDQRDPLMRK